MSYARGPLDSASFPDVLRAAKQGESWAAEQLFVDLQPRLLRYLRSGLERAAADELAGEVWLAMARGVGAFEGDLSSFRASMFTIAHRLVADHRRSAGPRSATPTERLSAQDAVDLITGSLPDEHAELLLLRVLGELDVLKVAEVMGRSPNWVRVTQHRALRRLADALEHTGRQEESDEAVIPQPRSAIFTS